MGTGLQTRVISAWPSSETRRHQELLASTLTQPRRLYPGRRVMIERRHLERAAIALRGLKRAEVCDATVDALWKKRTGRDGGPRTEHARQTMRSQIEFVVAEYNYIVDALTASIADPSDAEQEDFGMMGSDLTRET